MRRKSLTFLKNSYLLNASACLMTISLSACDAQTEGLDKFDHAIVERIPNAKIGRLTFVDKGCVICHSVNGVGGKAATPLDAITELDPIDPVAFAARMWRGAPAMIELQSLELGYTIWLEADDITNLAAFAADSTEQKMLRLEDVPKDTRELFLDQRYWEDEDWDEFLRRGQEGYGESEGDDPHQ